MLRRPIEPTLTMFNEAKLSHKGWQILAIVITMIVLSIIGWIPLLGSLICFIALLAGIGALTMLTYKNCQ